MTCYKLKKDSLVEFNQKYAIMMKPVKRFSLRSDTIMAMSAKSVAVHTTRRLQADKRLLASIMEYPNKIIHYLSMNRYTDTTTERLEGT